MIHEMRDVFIPFAAIVSAAGAVTTKLFPNLIKHLLGS